MGADLADMQLKSKFNKGIRFLLHVIDILVNMLWLFLQKKKKGITIVNAFQIVLNDPMKKRIQKENQINDR